jgi:hypothetical protein
MFKDPLGNEVNLTISTYLIPQVETDQYSRFRIKAYDSVAGREMCMDVSEVELRCSLKHDAKTFTYDDKDEAFHEKVLDRLVLVPTHDINNDGFLNADDVVRDDLNLALMEKNKFEPIKVSIEVGPKAVEKKRVAREEKERRRRERDSALKDHQMHSKRLMQKERVRQRSISKGKGLDLFGMTEDDKKVLTDHDGNFMDHDGHFVVVSANDLIIDKDGSAHFEKHVEAKMVGEEVFDHLAEDSRMMHMAVELNQEMLKNDLESVKGV